jgi:hypothetical protein
MLLILAYILLAMCNGDVPDGTPAWLTTKALFLDVLAGIGPNMLLARLATKSAKPNGQALIRPDQARQVNHIASFREPNQNYMLAKHP